MGFYFDPSKAQPVVLLQEGENVGVIADANYKHNRSGTGKLVEIAIAFGPVGAQIVIKDRLNVEHTSAMAQALGLARLKEVYAACGLGPCDTDMLRGRRVTVLLKKDSGSDGKMYFEVDSWIPAQATAKTAFSQQPPQNPHRDCYGAPPPPQQPQRSYQPPPVDDVPF
jgi:hypothetical protein